jgi:hypothetical protein
MCRHLCIIRDASSRRHPYAPCGAGGAQRDISHRHNSMGRGRYNCHVQRARPYISISCSVCCHQLRGIRHVESAFLPGRQHASRAPLQPGHGCFRRHYRAGCRCRVRLASLCLPLSCAHLVSCSSLLHPRDLLAFPGQTSRMRAIPTSVSLAVAHL